MKTFKITVVLASILLASCTVRYTPVANTEFSEVDFSQIRSFEKGVSCKRFIVGIIPLPLGQPSLINAAKDGKLRTVKVVDYAYGWGLLPIPYFKKCLVAYGVR